MRVAERARAGNPALVQQAGQRMDHRGFQRLVRVHFRHQPRHARGHHGFAGPRFADEKQVVTARGGDFHGAFGFFLSLDVGQVERAARGGYLARLRGGQDVAALEVVHRLQQRGGRDNLDRADPGGLGAAVPGAEQVAICLAGRDGGGQGAHDRNQLAVQRQLPQRYLPNYFIGRQNIHRRQNRERDRQVEMRAFLDQVGGRQVDGDPLRGQRQPQRRQRRAHPFPGLADRLVRQADDGKGGNAGGQRTLDLDETGLDPVKRHRVGPRDHILPLWLNKVNARGGMVYFW